MRKRDEFRADGFHPFAHDVGIYPFPGIEKEEASFASERVGDLLPPRAGFFSETQSTFDRGAVRLAMADSIAPVPDIVRRNAGASAPASRAAISEVSTTILLNSSLRWWSGSRAPHTDGSICTGPGVSRSLSRSPLPGPPLISSKGSISRYRPCLPPFRRMKREGEIVLLPLFRAFPQRAYPEPVETRAEFPQGRGPFISAYLVRFREDDEELSFGVDEPLYHDKIVLHRRVPLRR